MANELHRLVISGYLLAACGADAELRVAGVEELGQIQRPAGIQGRDGGVSGAFRGRSVWVYGDSVATEAGSYPNTWRNNTMSFTSDLDAADGIDGFVQPIDDLGAAREFFPRTLAEETFNQAHIDDGSCLAPCGARYAIWGSGPLYDEVRDRALLTYGKVYAEPGAWNFGIVGTSIAVWNDFDAGPERPRTDAGLADPTILFDEGEGEWAIPVIHDGDLYAFACSGFEDSHGCRLGRAPLDRVLERGAWRFYGDGEWSRYVSDAEELFDGSPNLTVHWNGLLQRWLAIYMDFGEIKARTAKQLQGPWSDTETLFEPEEDETLHALGHAEFQERDGEVEYVSYLAEEFRLLRVKLRRP